MKPRKRHLRVGGGFFYKHKSKSKLQKANTKKKQKASRASRGRHKEKSPPNQGTQPLISRTHARTKRNDFLVGAASRAQAPNLRSAASMPWRTNTRGDAPSWAQMPVEWTAQANGRQTASDQQISVWTEQMDDYA